MKSRSPVIVCSVLTTLLVGIWLGQKLPPNDRQAVERSTVSPFRSDGWQLAAGHESGPVATLPTELPVGRSRLSDSDVDPAVVEPVESAELPSGPDIAYFPEAMTEATGNADKQSAVLPTSRLSPPVAMSEEEAAIWNAELKNLPAGHAEEILSLREHLGSVSSESLGLLLSETPGAATDPPGLFPMLADGEARPIPIQGTLPKDAQVALASAVEESPLATQLREEAERNYVENISNAETPGFKRRQIVLLNVPVTAPLKKPGKAVPAGAERPTEALEPVSHGKDQTTPWLSRLDLRQGELISTSNPLDLAIDGPGWLQVDRNGRPEYVRAAVLGFDENRQLGIRTGGGVLPISPAVQFPETGRRIIISETGEISAIDAKEESHSIGQLMSYEFLNASALRRTDIGTWAETKDSGSAMVSPHSSVRFLQSFLEESNVDQQRELEELDHLQRVADQIARTWRNNTSP